MPHGTDHRHTAAANGPRQLFAVEYPQILARTAATGNDDHVNEVALL
ncbi:hypothetical protein SDC9_134711 [bioreactor metagenome]|uniref:Uncharacterized protein n=1 Tax=bioreactor metagenome TaxID=1076179 RepID=A0A645DEC7_9ZZZZ